MAAASDEEACFSSLEWKTERQEDSPESRVPSLVRSVLTQKQTLVGGAGVCEMEGAPASLVWGEERPATPVPRMVFR